MSEQSQRLARAEVRNLAVTDIGRKVMELGGVEALDPTQRKRMEYALLIGPISRGLTQYLDTAKFDEPRTHISGGDLLKLVGGSLALKVIEQLQDDASFSLASQLARERAAGFEKPLSENIYPLGKTIVTAAESSANALYDSAAASAMTAKAAGADRGRTRPEFINIVKRSVRLPVARTFAALAWQQGLDEATYRHAMAHVGLIPIAAKDTVLEYDPEKEEVVPTGPLETWPDHLNLSSQGPDSKIGDIKPADELIGCPISFNPKLVARYYEHMVDLIEYHQSWPAILNGVLPRIDI